LFTDLAHVLQFYVTETAYVRYSVGSSLHNNGQYGGNQLSEHGQCHSSVAATAATRDQHNDVASNSETAVKTYSSPRSGTRSHPTVQTDALRRLGDEDMDTDVDGPSAAEGSVAAMNSDDELYDFRSDSMSVCSSSLNELEDISLRTDENSTLSSIQDETITYSYSYGMLPLVFVYFRNLYVAN